jgi:stage V sporulation protein G
MEITDVRVYLREGGRTLKAFASVTLDGEFAVRDLKVVDGKKGLFVSMPSRKRTDGTYQDLAFPVTREMRETLHGRVLEAYRQASEGREG